MFSVFAELETRSRGLDPSGPPMVALIELDLWFIGHPKKIVNFYSSSHIKLGG